MAVESMKDIATEAAHLSQSETQGNTGQPKLVPKLEITKDGENVYGNQMWHCARKMVRE